MWSVQTKYFKFWLPAAIFVLSSFVCVAEFEHFVASSEKRLFGCKSTLCLFRTSPRFKGKWAFRLLHADFCISASHCCSFPCGTAGTACVPLRRLTDRGWHPLDIFVMLTVGNIFWWIWFLSLLQQPIFFPLLSSDFIPATLLFLSKLKIAVRPT